MKNGIKIDYLSVVLLQSDSGCDLESSVAALLDAWHLTDIWDKFENVGCNCSYAAIYRYQNININIPTVERFSGSVAKGQRRGIALNFSGSGLDFYMNYLQSKHISFQSCCKAFIGLISCGFKCKCNRLDVAIDDQCFGADKACLDLDVILHYLKSGYFVSKFRKGEPLRESGELVSCFSVDPKAIDSSLPYQVIESADLSSGAVGRTIYLGKRTSGTFCRFYDKKAEQAVKGLELPAGLKSWVRFELEFHRDNAMSVFLAFISGSDVEFSKFVSNVCFNLIRFIVPDKSRKYNCSVADWWLEFIGSIADKGIYINKLSSRRYVRAVKHCSRNVAIFAALFTANFDLWAKMMNDSIANPSKSYIDIVTDFKDFKKLSDSDQLAAIEDANREQGGIDYLGMFVPDPQKFLERLGA